MGKFGQFCKFHEWIIWQVCFQQIFDESAHFCWDHLTQTFVIISNATPSKSPLAPANTCVNTPAAPPQARAGGVIGFLRSAKGQIILIITLSPFFLCLPRSRQNPMKASPFALRWEAHSNICQMNERAVPYSICHCGLEANTQGPWAAFCLLYLTPPQYIIDHK